MKQDYDPFVTISVFVLARTGALGQLMPVAVLSQRRILLHIADILTKRGQERGHQAECRQGHRPSACCASLSRRECQEAGRDYQPFEAW